MDRATTAGATDAQLVAAVRRGDDRAFEGLYERYSRRIWGYVQGMVCDHARAEDITQDVFFSALRRMRQTERPIAFKPWIYEIARNACIDQFRRSKRAEEISFDAEVALADGDHCGLASLAPEPDVAVDAKQQLDHLCGAFGGLSEAHHRILVLRELVGLSYREIGEQMGLSRPAVESTLFRARKRLGEEYDELVSGRRCERVQGILAAAAEGMLGVRDKRRMARHISHCQQCRRRAHMLGIEHAPPLDRRVAAKLAALFPLPALLRRGPRGGDGVAGAVSHGGTLSQLSITLQSAADPVAAGWTKIAATAAAVLVAGVGAGAVTHPGFLSLSTLRHLPLIEQVTGRGANGDRGIGGPGSPPEGASGAATNSGEPVPATGDRPGAPAATGSRGGASSSATAAAGGAGSSTTGVPQTPSMPGTPSATVPPVDAQLPVAPSHDPLHLPSAPSHDPPHLPSVLDTPSPAAISHPTL